MGGMTTYLGMHTLPRPAVLTTGFESHLPRGDSGRGGATGISAGPRAFRTVTTTTSTKERVEPRVPGEGVPLPRHPPRDP